MKDAAKGLLVAALDELHSEFHAGRVTSGDPGDDRVDNRINPPDIAFDVLHACQFAGRA